ncbi:hypothetical protein [Stenomitos frigidus]|uniref:Uncharacterized protein n=1 Tax=Stenomitos frigidus ULC18 TaxID=2107698 RepID=A0A2T1E1V0_9CYAN|nr:hypothetical protein [Stenomitos frigidus]PSB26736.1 hypothetical protein C7B82_18820 [Stenomitos frigidus ULC18]
MRTRDPQALDNESVYAKRSHGHGGLSFLTTLAFLLSLLSLGVSGFLAYRFLNLQQAFSAVDTALNRNPAKTSPNVEPLPGQAPTQTAPPTQSSGETASQAGQLNQPAINQKAQVEIIAVNRIQNPNTKLRDFVNIQFRVRRLAPKTDALSYEQGVIYPGSTTARNPTTGETYPAVDRINRATSNISVSELNPNATADAYVWIQIPEGTSAIDILIPKTQAFKNVPISG